MKKNTLLSIVVTVAIFFAVRVAYTQDFLVKGQSTNIFKSQNTSTASADKVAVVGVSIPAANWGYGGDFNGGYMGLRATSTMSMQSALWNGKGMHANRSIGVGVVSGFVCLRGPQ